MDAVLRRAPAVALVDELAHTNVPGSRNTKRWQDVEELLAAGIDVISTVNIQHLESLGDVVESITGVRQRETVPDKVDAALSNYFRHGNLTAPRELALLWVADRVDAYLTQYRSEHEVSAIWGSRERIVVGLTGGPEGRTLIRRAARLAEKGAGGEVMAVYFSRSDGLTAASPKELLSAAGPTRHRWGGVRRRGVGACRPIEAGRTAGGSPRGHFGSRLNTAFDQR